MFRILLLMVLWLGIIPMLFGHFYFKNSRKKFMTLPIELVNNLVIIKVQINGSDTLKFILDTGVKTSILTELFPDQDLNLSYQGYINVLGLGGQDTIKAKLSTNNKIEIDAIEGIGFNLLSIVRYNIKLSPNLGVKVNGLIGYDLLKNFVLRIDYIKQQIIFYSPPYFEKLRRYKKWARVNLNLERYKPYLDLQVKQSAGELFRAKFLLDLGAGHNLALYHFNDARLRLPEPRWKAFLGTGLGGPLEGYLGRIEFIKIGPYYLNNVITDFPDRDDIENILYISNRQGSIGSGIARRFSMILDYQHKQLYLKKNKYFRRPFNFNYTGLSLKCNFSFPRLYYVAYVVKDSPAHKAGFQVGDYILEINNIKTFNLKSNRLYYILQKKRKFLKIKILRKNILLKKRINLAHIWI